MSMPRLPEATVFANAAEKEYLNQLIRVLRNSLNSLETILNDKTSFIYSGAGSPENNVSALVGSLYLRTDGGANTTLYVKESGTSTTGWIAK